MDNDMRECCFYHVFGRGVGVSNIYSNGIGDCNVCVADPVGNPKCGMYIPFKFHVVRVGMRLIDEGVMANKEPAVERGSEKTLIEVAA